MATKQYTLAPGVYINETGTKQYILAPGVYLNDTSTTATVTIKVTTLPMMGVG